MRVREEEADDGRRGGDLHAEGVDAEADAWRGEEEEAWRERVPRNRLLQCNEFLGNKGDRAITTTMTMRLWTYSSHSAPLHSLSALQWLAPPTTKRYKLSTI